MEKTQSLNIDHNEDICLENYIDWLIACSDENVSSDDKVVDDLVSKRIVCGMRKRTVDEKTDNHSVKDLIINEK